MSENTITIPADLNGHLGNSSPASMRRYADELSERTYAKIRPHCAIDLIRWLADEIERQAPRPEGWYHVETQAWERAYWWDGTEWTKGHQPLLRVPVPDDATITPVTIGGAS